MEVVEGRFGLPRPKRAGWIVVAVVGVATALFGASALGSDPLEGLPIAYVALGSGLFLAFFALGMLTLRERPAILELTDRCLAIETLGGEKVSLPWVCLRQAIAMPQSDGQQSVVALRKSDGGWVELATFRDEEAAARLVDQLQLAIGSAGEAASGPERRGAGLPRLDDLPGIAVTRDDERTTLAWSATSFGGLLALGPIAGLFVTVYGFHRNQPSTGTFVAMGFVAALAVLVVVFTLIDVGAEQRLVLGRDEMAIHRTRFGRVIAEQSLALSSIAAVDYTHRLNVLGASSLTIRTDHARLASEGAERQAAEAADDPERLDPVALGAALVKAIAGGVHVPLGRLPLASRVGLDLALSEEVARRTGRAAGSV